jgi:hypothetical protein
MLQPILSLGLALYDAISNADFELIVALIEAWRAQTHPYQHWDYHFPTSRSESIL